MRGAETRRRRDHPKEETLITSLEEAWKIGLDLGLNLEALEFAKGEFKDLCWDLGFSPEDVALIAERVGMPEQPQVSGEKQTLTPEVPPKASDPLAPSKINEEKKAELNLGEKSAGVEAANPEDFIIPVIKFFFHPMSVGYENGKRRKKYVFLYDVISRRNIMLNTSSSTFKATVEHLRSHTFSNLGASLGSKLPHEAFIPPKGRRDGLFSLVPTFWLFLYQILMGNLSLDIMVQIAKAWFSSIKEEVSISFNTNAYSQARKRVPLEFFRNTTFQILWVR